jgi:hypothetical protein
MKRHWNFWGRLTVYKVSQSVLYSSMCRACQKLTVSYIFGHSFALPALFKTHLTHVVHGFDLEAFFVILRSFSSSMSSLWNPEYVHFASFWPCSTYLLPLSYIMLLCEEWCDTCWSMGVGSLNRCLILNAISEYLSNLRWPWEGCHTP